MSDVTEMVVFALTMFAFVLFTASASLFLFLRPASVESQSSDDTEMQLDAEMQKVCADLYQHDATASWILSHR